MESGSGIKASTSVPQGPQAAPGRLRGGSLNLSRLAFIGLAYFSLAPAIYLNMGFMETDANGPVMPLLFILITIAILPTAVSFAVMNNRRPSAGSGSTWLWESTSPVAGLWLAWMMITAYLVVCSIYPPGFGLFFNSLLSIFGIGSNVWTGILGGVISVLICGYIAHRNIRLGAAVIGVLMVFEAGFVLLLSLFIVVRGGTLGHFSGTPFDPTAAKAGFTGLSLAAIFAFLSIAGVDSVAPVAEESHTPKRLIPLATILITLIAGLYWTIASYGFAISVPVQKVADYVNAGQLTPVLPIAHQYIGALDILVPITGFTATLASFGASVYAASRLMYATSREGFLPSFFSRLHPSHHTPWNAEATALGVALVLFLLGTWWQGSVAGSFGYLAEIFVFFILVAYLAVNLANLVYHLRYKRNEFNWLLNGVVPALGIVIDGYILYKAFFQAELGLPFQTGSSIVWFSLAWAVIGAAWAVWWSSRRNLAEVRLTEFA
jgi:amino acid transporter